MITADIQNDRAATRRYMEDSVLGYVILSPDFLVEAQALRVEDFSNDAARKVYAAILEINRSGQPCDIVRLADRLRDKVRVTYLDHLLNRGGEMLPCNHGEFIQKIIACAKADKIYLELMGRLRDIVGLDIDKIKENLADMESIFLSIHQPAEITTNLIEKHADSALIEAEAVFKKQKMVAGIATGYDELDTKIGGISPAMIVIAGRPGHCKTTLGMNLIKSIVERTREPAIVFSLETGAKQLFFNLAAAQAGINVFAYRTGELGNSEHQALCEAIQAIRSLPIYINDKSGITIGEIDAEISRMIKRGKSPACVLIDYLQLLAPAPEMRRASRYEQVSENSRRIKMMQTKHGIPIIALAQLNRDLEGRTDKHPQISDLRDSGTIEQDADIVLLLQRPELYWPEKPEVQNKLAIFVGKNRLGPAGGACSLFFNQKCLKITNEKTNNGGCKNAGDWRKDEF